MKHQPCLMTIEEQKQIKAFLYNSEKFIETVVEEIADEVEKRMDEKKPLHAKAFAFVGKKIETAAITTAKATITASHIVAEKAKKTCTYVSEKVENFKHRNDVEEGDFGTHCVITINAKGNA